MITVYTTLPDMDTAKEISYNLIEDELVSCANIHEVESVYRWQGEVVENGEIAVDFKTARNFQQVKDRLSEMHPYDTPLIITRNVEGVNNDGESWIEQTSGTDAVNI